MDAVSRQVFFGQDAVHIGPTEYRLLEFFMSHENRAYSRSQLLDHLWVTNVFLEERTVDVHIRRLRKNPLISKSRPQLYDYEDLESSTGPSGPVLF